MSVDIPYMEHLGMGTICIVGFLQSQGQFYSRHRVVIYPEAVLGILYQCCPTYPTWSAVVSFNFFGSGALHVWKIFHSSLFTSTIHEGKKYQHPGAFTFGRRNLTVAQRARSIEPRKIGGDTLNSPAPQVIGRILTAQFAVGGTFCLGRA